MKPHEVCNPRRRLRAQRRNAIQSLSNLREEFPRPKPAEARLIEEAQRRVTRLQNADGPEV